MIRRCPTYLEIRSRLGISDALTLLLIQVGDLHLAHVGQVVSRRPWSRSHVLVGLSAKLAVAGGGEISAPWLVDDPDLAVELTVSSPGTAMFIDRRHLHLVERGLNGTVEPVGRLIRAALHRPPVEQRRNVESPVSDQPWEHPAGR